MHIADRATEVMERTMIQLKIYNGAAAWAGRNHTFVATLDRISPGLRAQAAAILRTLILALVGLLFVLVGLMLVTGRVEVGGPILGGVLLAGFGASQFARRRHTNAHE